VPGVQESTEGANKVFHITCADVMHFDAGVISVSFVFKSVFVAASGASAAIDRLVHST